MKHLIEYKLTEKEIEKIFGSQREYEDVIRIFEERPDNDSEKLYIANLLFLRGKKKESSEMIESIEDEEYRRCCLQDYYCSWCAWEEGCM